VDRYNIFFGFTFTRVSRSIHMTAITIATSALILLQFFLLFFIISRNSNYLKFKISIYLIMSLILFLIKGTDNNTMKILQTLFIVFSCLILALRVFFPWFNNYFTIAISKIENIYNNIVNNDQSEDDDNNSKKGEDSLKVTDDNEKLSSKGSDDEINVVYDDQVDYDNEPPETIADIISNYSIDSQSDFENVVNSTFNNSNNNENIIPQFNRSISNDKKVPITKRARSIIDPRVHSKKVDTNSFIKREKNANDEVFLNSVIHSIFLFIFNYFY
jgi:hypothetical protein